MRYKKGYNSCLNSSILSNASGYNICPNRRGKTSLSAFHMLQIFFQSSSATAISWFDSNQGVFLLPSKKLISSTHLPLYKEWGQKVKELQSSIYLPCQSQFHCLILNVGLSQLSLKTSAWGHLFLVGGLLLKGFWLKIRAYSSEQSWIQEGEKNKKKKTFPKLQNRQSLLTFHLLRFCVGGKQKHVWAVTGLPLVGWSNAMQAQQQWRLIMQLCNWNMTWSLRAWLISS